MAHERGLDLVLINPSSRTEVYQSLGATLAAIEPPVWAGLMAAFVRNRGLSVAIIDAEAENLTPEQTATRVQEIKPLLTAVVVYGHQPSASTQNMPAAHATCAAMKNLIPQQKLLLVGGHVAALPGRTLREEPVDFVAGGEGLYTMVELIEVLRSRPLDYSRVRGLWYRDGEAIYGNVAAPLVGDLDREIPAVTWDLLPMTRYRAHNWHCFGDLRREPYAAVYTTLGCPYHCTFCCIQSPFKAGESALGYKQTVNSYRYWTPHSVIAQIDTLVQQHNVRNIKFADEMFVLNPAHVGAICDFIIERRYDLNIWAYARVDTVRDDMVERLKRAGFNWLAFGIEAASERVRDGVQKGFDQQQVFKTIEKVRSAGINVIGNYIFGLPDDDSDSMKATLDLAIELNCEFANFYSTMAYPGSPLYEMALKSGWPLPEKWSGFSQHSVDTLPLPTKHLSAAEVLRFRDDAFQTYFSNPSYLQMIKLKFGQETADHIRQMASHKLVRKCAS
jgi:anaerobic magnesium-protoporphyrin IX monomethyl ester cyclase